VGYYLEGTECQVLASSASSKRRLAGGNSNLQRKSRVLGHAVDVAYLGITTGDVARAVIACRCILVRHAGVEGACSCGSAVVV